MEYYHQVLKTESCTNHYKMLLFNVCLDLDLDNDKFNTSTWGKTNDKTGNVFVLWWLLPEVLLELLFRLLLSLMSINDCSS